jgi:ketopantoate reductase
MLSDCLARRRIEIDALVGVVVRKGDQYGIRTPASETVFRLLNHINPETRSQTK